MRLTTRLAPIELEDADGLIDPIGDQWRDRAVVLVFLRHFG